MTAELRFAQYKMNFLKHGKAPPRRASVRRQRSPVIRCRSGVDAQGLSRRPQIKNYCVLVPGKSREDSSLQRRTKGRWMVSGRSKQMFPKERPSATLRLFQFPAGLGRRKGNPDRIDRASRWRRTVLCDPLPHPGRRCVRNYRLRAHSGSG